MFKRTIIVAAAATGSVLVGPAAAVAQLAPAGGLVGEVTGTVGQIVGGTTQDLSDSIEQLLGGGGTTLPPEVLGDLLAAPGASPAPTLAPGSLTPTSTSTTTTTTSTATTGGRTAPVTGTPGATAPDGRAPAATVRVLSRLRDVGRTGRLRLQVASDEPGVVAFTTMVRPGQPRRGVARRIRHDRSVIHLAPVVVAFHRAGSVPVSIRLAPSARRRLARSRNGRVSVGVLAADAARNQRIERLKRRLRR